MKIAIQGHLSRGKEVIQILKSLGGKSRDDLTGRMFSQYYFINCHGDIDLNLKINLLNYKFYTIEEFPFKIGDKVKDSSDNEIGTILGFIDIDDELMYVVNFEKSGHANMPVEELKPYKEMEKERNIKLTIDKAKEWYKKGGELREIALQAFTEIELNPLPRSWEEFCEKYPIKTSEAVICTESTIVTCDYSEIRDSDCDREICPSIKSAEAHLAMIQLEQLRDCWRQGWKPIWDISHKWCIRLDGNGLVIGIVTSVSRFLTFPTKEMAEEFLECFRDLIEKAEDLI